MRFKISHPLLPFVLVAICAACARAYAAYEPYYERSLEYESFNFRDPNENSIAEREWEDEISMHIRLDTGDTDFKLEARDTKEATERCCGLWERYRYKVVEENLKTSLDMCISVGKRHLGVTVPTTWRLPKPGESKYNPPPRMKGLSDAQLCCVHFSAYRGSLSVQRRKENWMTVFRRCKWGLESLYPGHGS